MKRRRRRRPQSANLSLFPFLAVLICTCGVLIVLLVLAAKNADVEARKVADENVETLRQEIDMLVGEIELQQERADGLRSIRDELLERLDEVLNVRAHLENEISRLNEQAQSLADRWQALNRAPVQADENLDREIEQLQGQLVALRETVERTRREQAAAPAVMYSIVPYEGARGQARVPFYVECTADSLVVQPFDLRMAIDDFAVPLTESNPLEQALMTVRRYFVQNGLLESMGTPYPLLIVRPDGAESYALARHAMKGWGDEFGYELIPQDMQLDYGPADEELRQLLQQNIEAEIRRQHAIRARLATHPIANHQSTGSPGSPGGGWRADHRGGFVYQSDPEQNASGSGRSGRSGSSSSAPAQLAHHQQRGQKTEQQTSQASSESQAGPTPAGGPSSAADGQQAVPGQPGEGQANGSNADSLANRRGSNWALPNRTPGAVGYLRPIRVVCTADELVVRGVDGRQSRIAFSDRPEAAIDKLVEQVWQIIDSWGVAGTNAYWKPEIRFTVAPGGDRRVAELKQLMSDSGWLFEEDRE